ncbi:MAG TPA: hypothetical protein VK752_16285 [Bryobacteraceae bacterium]|nr:hypothetical protein [Bryobacteraceae bacterium]
MGNLVANCGFESGDFAGWTLAGNDVPGEQGNLYGVEGVDPFDGIAPHSGSFQAYFADLDANATTLSQSIATTSGTSYTVTFYLAQDTATIPPYSNEFSASFGGTSLVSMTGAPVEGYTKYSYTAMATSSSTLLSLTLGNDLGEYLLDDVSVTAASRTSTPEPAALGLLLIPVILVLVKLKRATAS